MRGEGDGEEIASRIHESLRKVAEDLQENRIPLEKFIISKVLVKMVWSLVYLFIYLYMFVYLESYKGAFCLR